MTSSYNMNTWIGAWKVENHEDNKLLITKSWIFLNNFELYMVYNALRTMHK
jgi:hypothetical protein